MNGKDIFLGLEYVGDDLIEKAEYGEFPTKAEKTEKKTNTRKLTRRPFLVAAVIAMMLLLIGCAIVYVLSLDGLKLDDQTVTQDVYEYDPNGGEAIMYIGQETYTQQVLTLAGLNGTPASQAAREWYEFCKNYDPDREIQRSVWGNYPDFPAEYNGYGLYTQEMKDMLDRILEKYNLKLRGPFYRPRLLHDRQSGDGGLGQRLHLWQKGIRPLKAIPLKNLQTGFLPTIP